MGDADNTSFDEAIDMKLWYLQLAYGPRTVRVAGFRAIDQHTLQRYMSSPIVRRESAICIMSKHHTYRLMGCMDEMMAETSGFPTELIPYFRNGFPPNWDQIINDFFEETSFDKSQWAPDTDCTHRTMVGSNQMRSSFLPRNSTTFTAQSSNSGPRRSILRNSTAPEQQFERNEGSSKNGRRKSVFIIEPNEQREETTHQAILPSPAKTNERVQASPKAQNKEQNVFDVPANLISSNEEEMQLIVSAAKKKPLIEISFWMFRFSIPKNNIDMPAIVISGLIFDEELEEWIQSKTSEIVHVENKKIVYTKSSSRYELGTMDNAYEYGLPEWVENVFGDGFPSDWKQILEKIYRENVSETEMVERNQEQLADNEKRRSMRLSFPSPPTSGNSSDSRNKTGALNIGRKSIGDKRTQTSTRPIDNWTNQKSVATDIELNSTGYEHELMREARRVEKKMKREKKDRRLLAKRLSVVYESDLNKTGKSTSEEVVFKRPFDIAKNNKISPECAKKAIVPGVTKAEELKTTRSGRLVHSPLANWAGEKIVYDIYGNAIGISGITTQTDLTLDRKTAADAAAIGRHYGMAISPLRTTKQAQRALQCPKKEPQVIRRVKAKSNYDDSIYSTEEDACIERLGKRFGTSESGHSTPGQPMRKRVLTCRILSDDSPDDDDNDYQIEAPKRKKKKKEVGKTRQKQVNIKLVRPKKEMFKRKKAKNDEVKNLVENKRKSRNGRLEDEEESAFSPITSEKRRQHAIKNAKPEVLNRLKIGIKLHRPKDDADWERFATQLGTMYDAKTWKELAIHHLNWKPHVEDAPTNDETISSQSITARQGTIAYQMQADRFTRNYMRTGGNNDYFEGNKENTIMEEETTNVFDADDSMIELMVTPKPTAAIKNKRNVNPNPEMNKNSRKKKDALTALMEKAEEEDEVSRTRASFTPRLNSVDRQKAQRYVAHLKSNLSAINQSSFLMK